MSSVTITLIIAPGVRVVFLEFSIGPMEFGSSRSFCANSILRAIDLLGKSRDKIFTVDGTFAKKYRIVAIGDLLARQMTV